MRYECRPEEIEKKSMEIIGAQLAGRVIPPENEGVIKRVIHTTADFDYADNLYFSPGAVEAFCALLKKGATVITDTNMALAGINKKNLSALSGRALCFMADEDVMMEAKDRCVTRAFVSMEKAALTEGEKIFAVGNAPTALLAIKELTEKGDLRPSAIIAVPVGFVNVVFAKEEAVRLCEELGIPCIAAMGRKGGSNVAAAILNSLMITSL